MKKILIFTAAIVILSIACSAERYGYGLPASGSQNTIHTIFTNPGENSTNSMNISFATPPGTKAFVEVTDEDGRMKTFESEGELCDTYDNVRSKLSDGTDVVERHVFDKHDVTLMGLKPNTEYEYRVVADSAGTKVYSEPRWFRSAGADSWKAAIIGDFHHYSPSWRRLDAAMEMVDVLDSVADGIYWVLSTGDVCAWGGSYNFWTELSEQPAFMNNMWAIVQGNHDHQTRDNIKSDSFFRDALANPWNGYTGQEGIVYWFKYGDVLFLMLNNEAMRASGSLTPVIEWMEKVIADNPSKYIVVVEHSEWLIGTDGKSSNLNRWYKTFDRLGVDLAIAGNNHAYIRTKPLKDRLPVEPEEGTYYVVTPSSDNARGRALKPIKENKDIIAERWSEGDNTVGGMVMDVNPERIVMTLYNRYGEVKDTFTVPAKR